MKVSETTTTALKTALKSGNKAWKQARSSTYLTALRKIPLTGLGWLVLLGGLASLGAYLAWDWAEAAAIMFAALLALLAAVAQTWGGGELALRVTVAQDRLRKGQELIGRAVATNNGRRAVRALNKPISRYLLCVPARVSLGNFNCKPDGEKRLWWGRPARCGKIFWD